MQGGDQAVEEVQATGGLEEGAGALVAVEAAPPVSQGRARQVMGAGELPSGGAQAVLLVEAVVEQAGGGNAAAPLAGRRGVGGGKIGYGHGSAPGAGVV